MALAQILQSLSLVVALLAAGNDPQRVPTPDELRLYDDGAKALGAGDARGAEKAWKAGYAVAHDPAFLVHVGEAEEKAGAAETYRRYLREVPDAADRADIQQRIARLASGTPVPAMAPGPAETPGEFGGTAPAAPATTAPAAPAPLAAAPGAAHPDAEHPAGGDSEDSGWNRYNVTAMVAAGATVALLGTAAYLGATAASHESDVNRLVDYRAPPPLYSSVASSYTSAMNDGRSDAHVARVLLLTAAGTGVISIVFFILDAKLAPASAPALAVAPSDRGLTALGGWSWRF